MKSGFNSTLLPAAKSSSSIKCGTQTARHQNLHFSTDSRLEPCLNILEPTRSNHKEIPTLHEAHQWLSCQVPSRNANSRSQSLATLTPKRYLAPPSQKRSYPSQRPLAPKSARPVWTIVDGAESFPPVCLDTLLRVLLTIVLCGGWLSER